jgi:DNA ligase-1
MIEVAKVINLIGNTSSSNDKLYLLKKNENVPGLKTILKFIYDPYTRTGISKAKLAKALKIAEARGPYVIGNEPFISYTEMIDYLKTHTTGNDCDITMAARFINCTKVMYPEAEELAKAIVTQDLKIGVTATSLNKVYGADFIPKIGCMLGTLYGDVGPEKTKWPCIVTEKLDGIRRILVKENGVCRCYSRSGHEDTGLIEIVEDAKYLPNNTVYDGELLAAGTFKDCIAQRQATNSIANSKGDKTGLTFNVFDMVPLDEFRAGISNDKALVRKITLGATLMDESIQHLEPDKWPMLIQAFGIHTELKAIRPVPILGLVKCMADVEPIVNEIWARGGEGVMLNSTVGKYEIKRSKELLKVKHTEEHVLEVVDILEGTGKFEGMMGALVVDYNGNKLGVGSGFNDAQRKDIWDNPEKYLGRSIEIDTFGESTNALGEKSLNCPIFKRFVGEEE